MPTKNLLDWRTVRLGDICAVDWGNTTLTKALYSSEGFPAFSATGKDGLLPFYEHDGQAVIVSAIGARCGKCFFAGGKWTAIKNTIIVQSSDPDVVDERFLFFLLDDENKWPRSGSGQPFIGIGKAQDIRILLPSFPEQKAIAHALQTVQEAKATRQRELALERESKTTLREHLFSRGTGNTTTKRIDQFDVPEDWSIKPFGTSCEFLQYGTSERCDAGEDASPVLGIPNVVTGKVDLRNVKYLKTDNTIREKLTLVDGDLIFVRTNATRGNTGKCAVFRDEAAGALFASYLIRARLTTGSLLPAFVREYTETWLGKAYLAGRASNAADGKFNINTQTIRSVLIPHPSWDEQIRIVTILKACDAKLVALEKEIAALEELFDVLLGQLMTGRLSVTNLIGEHSK